MEVCLEGLKQANIQHPFKLRLIAPRSTRLAKLNFDSLDVQWLNIDRVDVERSIRSFDIGLCPLNDQPWVRFKNNAKTMQYMLARVPPVASELGYNRQLIQTGRTGWLVPQHLDPRRTAEAWCNAILSALSDAASRRRIGVEARKSILQTHSIERWATTYRDALLGKLGVHTSAGHSFSDGC